MAALFQHFTKEEKAQLDAGQIPEDWSGAKRRQKDVDATHTKKHGKPHHGYKLSTSVDVRSKFIRKVHTDTASEHDSTHFEEVLDVLRLKDDIQRKTQKGKPLSDCQKGRNRRIAKTRAPGERPYAQIRRMGGKLIRAIGQARATVAMTLMAACHNIKRLARFLHDGVDPFYKKKRRTGGQVCPEAADA